MSFPHRAMSNLRSLPQKIMRQTMKRLLRLLFQLQGQRRRWAQSGFVFPTTVLLLLVVALTASALTYRAYSRSSQAILERQQQVITNATTPAIDRAKAKLDYLLTQDTRSPRKVPTSDQMAAMLQATVTNTNIEIVEEDTDIYTLPGEFRLDINGDGTDDNAWYFTSDLNNDGAVDDNEVVAYSILIDDNNSGIDLNDDINDDKAAALVTRNGPISTSEVLGDCETAGADTGQRSAEGWQISNGTTIEKNFQVNAFVANLNDVSRVASTLEFQQVRAAARSNKWGAWFRYDLSVSPGPRLNWNGAMHTQGSFLTKNNFRAYMISSTKSCLYDESASEITLGAENASNNFKGQFIYGNELGFATGNGPIIHVDDGDDKPAQVTISDDPDNDSIASATAGVGDVMLDPVEVYLNDVSQHVDTSSWTPQDIDDALDGRVRNIGSAELRSITLDDAFRADNRWGPKRVYDPEDATTGQVPSGTSIGSNIGSISKLTNDSGGLDGYWERQAINLGTRIVVGERLELGDANGWNYDPITDTTGVTPGDALYPADSITPNTVPGSSGNFGFAEQKQRKSLRDNLAAVQGMVIYRWDLGGATPQACIAVTAHPGTLQTKINSRTYRQRTDNGGADVMTDFLTGNGTNGWEFALPTADMTTPLENLARFAGDPDGGAPSFAPVQDTFVHPYPYMSMWGDYSTLRRVQDEGNGSPADATYEDTAACTLGLLAYNLSAIKAEYVNVAASDWKTLAAALEQAYVDSSEALASEDYAAWKKSTGIVGTSNEQLTDIGGHYWTVERDRAFGFATGLGLPISSAGDTFSAGTGTYDELTGTFRVTSEARAVFAANPNPADPPYEVTCDPHIFANSAYGASNDLDEALALALALCPKQAYYPSLYYLFPVAAHDQDGGETLPAGTYGGVATVAGTATVDQPTDEPYIQFVVGLSEYNQNASFNVVDYAATGLAATPRTPSGSWTLGKGAASADAAFTTVWTSNTTDPSYPSLPDQDPFRVVVTDAAGANPSAFTVRAIDKGVFSGRELLNTRLLDLDVGALTTNNWIYGKDTVAVEHNGLVYAYREDAVREDEIVRPTSGTLTGCNTYAKLKAYDPITPGCYMQHHPTGVPATADVLDATDPPLITDSNVSLKPVDYAPDPDRRPYGFRLRNGSTLNRATDEQSGISFITDNTVVIQGDFNLHTHGTTPPTPQEEFIDPTRQIFKLDPEGGGFFNAFYDRENLNLSIFANSGQDSWRPAEILGDAVHIFSDGFSDGFVEAAYVHNAASTGNNTFAYNTNAASGKVSYQNRNPFGNTTLNQKRMVNKNEIVREGRGDTQAPIYFDRNGVVYNSGTGNRLAQDDINTAENYIYWGFSNILPTSDEEDLHSDLDQFRTDYLTPASGETTVNALLISGIVPGRDDQVYGGLHNFPRFDEYWDDTKQNIAGGFFQLFFSTSATAPFDQDAWEFDDSSDDDRFIEYYFPPDRVWGYDVALQYSPQSPIASRFTSVGDPRSEFYRELPVDDPYIKMLRCAEYTGPSGNVQIDPKATCS
jgi:hypothetical protein